MAVDWTQGMSQRLACFEVDPATWREVRELRTATSCTVVRELDAELLESASLEADEPLGEVYVRAYIVAEQGGESERVPVATFLVQTPSESFDGKVSVRAFDGYSPLVELRDDMPPLGYSVPAGSNCVSVAASVAAKACRAPVSMLSDDSTLTEDYVAQEDDTWLSFCAGLLAKASMRLTVAPDGTVGCEPVRDAATLGAAHTFSDGECSILMQEAADEADWYGLPNVYEAVLSTADGFLRSEAVNDDPDSPLSTVSRGRRVVVRDTSPELPEEPTQADIDAYALRRLREESAREHRVTFTHGWAGNAIGQGVRLAYGAAGIDRTMQTTKQTIEIKAGVSVEEEAAWSEVMFR